MSVGCNDKYQQIFVLFKHHLVVLDAPEHEDDAGNDGKGECVGEVSESCASQKLIMICKPKLSFDTVTEMLVQFASKILTPRRMD